MESRKKARMEAVDAANIQKIEHPTLRRYYQRISTLRNYLISSLPDQAKSRRRKIKAAGLSQDGSLTIGRIPNGKGGGTASAASPRPDERDRPSGDSQTRLAALLDSTLVCTAEAFTSPFKSSREKDLIKFSQQAEITFASTLDGGTTSISDVSNESSSTELSCDPFRGHCVGNNGIRNPLVEEFATSYQIKAPLDYQMY